ncbi:unnamed protein product, partial [marine sediment metagenome]
MSRAYIVKYSGGTYDDYYEHNVFVSVNKSKATKYVTKFNNILKKWKDYYAQFEYKKGHSIAWIKD